MRSSLFSILSGALVFVLLSSVGLNAESQYVYFGYAPVNIKEYGTTHLYVVGNHDGTSVSVYSLPELGTLAEFVVDRLEERSLPVPSGCMFKVVSDKPVTVILAGGSAIASVTASISTFYTSVEGGYLGREFIFRTFYKEEGSGGVYTVYALQKSEVTVYDSSGAEVTSFELAANEFRDFILDTSKVHRLVSTGYIMLQSFFVKNLGHGGGVWQSHAVPSLEGTFVGKHFCERCTYPGYYSGGYEPPFEFIFSSSSDAQIRLYDHSSRAKLGEETIQAGTNKSFSFQNQHLFFETSEPTALITIGGGGGLLAAGLTAGEAAYIHVPSEESFLFTYTETVLSLDEVQYSLEANSVFQLPTGLHKVEADRTVVFTIVHRGWGTALAALREENETWFETSFGACLPSVQSLELEYPDVKILTLEEAPWLLYAESAVAVVVIVVVAIFVRKRATSR